MARHSAPVEEPEAPEPEVAPPKQKRNLFADQYLPHWGFGAITALYVGFNIAAGIAAVPPTISLGWTTTLGLWFHYLIKQRADNKESTNA